MTVTRVALIGAGLLALVAGDVATCVLSWSWAAFLFYARPIPWR
jgi:hypothetical protein